MRLRFLMIFGAMWAGWWVALNLSGAPLIAASVKPVELRCEYLNEPLGLDVTTPRLSWKLQAIEPRHRGQRQTSYHILVASTEKLLQSDQADVWDSGTVCSAESVNQAYGGRPLKSGDECFWKVCAADEHGVWSAWSRPAHWTMGPLSAADWKASWIGSPDALPRLSEGPPTNNIQSDPWLRKTFDLPATPVRAVIYVASVGYHELYVNGQRIGDSVLEPATSDLGRRARYVTYDISQQLRPGRNVIGIWLGVSWSIFPAYQTSDKPAAPMVLAQAEIDLPQAAPLQIVTDETWKTHPSPNKLLGFWNAHGFGGELYDADMEITNWCDTNLNDAGWQAAKTFHPKLVVSADKTEPNRLVKEIQPSAVTETTHGTYRVDMGVNYAGWFQIQLSGQPGDRIEFQFSERTNASMTFGLHSTYIIGPSGKGVFCNRFNYMSGRWVQITGLRSKPALSQIQGWLIRTDYQRAAGFTCDQPLLNKIYNTTLWTFENLTLGSYLVDCPQRERRGYGGDGSATIRTALDNYQLGAFCTKWMEDWRDVQEPDGFVPHTAPTHVGGGGPAWSGFCVTLPWEMYCQYGDQRLLQESFPTIQRWLAFLETKSKNDLLTRYGGSWDFLGDWQWPHFGTDRRLVEKTGKFLGDTRESLFFNNCVWIYNLETAAKIANVIGKQEVSDAYRKRAETVRHAVHANFFNPADHGYVNGFPTYLAIALLVDLPPAELRPAVWQRLAQEILVKHQGHVWAGITGGGFLFNTLLENDRNDLIDAMVGQRSYPGWGDLLGRGATTFYEDWDAGGSYLHNSYLYAGSWFIEALGGIRRPEAGYKHFVIEPWIDQHQGPRKVSAYYDSLYGRIATEWQINNGRLRLDVTVPPSTEASLRLHHIPSGSIQEGGLTLGQTQGITLESETREITTLRLQPGIYHFNATIEPQ